MVRHTKSRLGFRQAISFFSHDNRFPCYLHLVLGLFNFIQRFQNIRGRRGFQAGDVFFCLRSLSLPLLNEGVLLTAIEDIVCERGTKDTGVMDQNNSPNVPLVLPLIWRQTVKRASVAENPDMARTPAYNTLQRRCTPR